MALGYRAMLSPRRSGVCDKAQKNAFPIYKDKKTR